MSDDTKNESHQGWLGKRDRVQKRHAAQNSEHRQEVRRARAENPIVATEHAFMEELARIAEERKVHISVVIADIEALAVEPVEPEKPAVTVLIGADLADTHEFGPHKLALGDIVRSAFDHFDGDAEAWNDLTDEVRSALVSAEITEITAAVEAGLAPQAEPNEGDKASTLADDSTREQILAFATDNAIELTGAEKKLRVAELLALVRSRAET